ncbi:ribonuclease H-like domain-containing protein [Tanacetum coccineum]
MSCLAEVYYKGLLQLSKKNPLRKESESWVKLSTFHIRSLRRGNRRLQEKEIQRESPSPCGLGHIQNGVGKHLRIVARHLGMECIDDNDPFLPSVQEAYSSHDICFRFLILKRSVLLSLKGSFMLIAWSSRAKGVDMLKHNQLMRLVQFLMGFNDIYRPIRSSLLSRETFLDVQDAFAIISREESHIGIASSSGFVPKPQVSSLNNTVNTSGNNRGPNLNLLCKDCGKVGHTIERSFHIIGYPLSPSLFFTNDQMMKLMSLINDRCYSGQYGSIGWIINSGANQHMTVNTKNMFGVIDISDLNLTMGNPNRTVAKIKYVGILQLSKDVVLYDVLVVPKYCVSLLSMHKLIRDSKLFVGFDENKCCIQDLTQNKIVIGVLQKELQMSKDSHVSPCDICHKSKQIREPFPLSQHKTSDVGDLIHLDLWGPYKLNFFDSFDIQTSKSPYDEGRVTPNDEGSALNTPNIPRNVSGGGKATSMGDKSISEGNYQNTQSVLFFQDPNDVGLNIPISDPVVATRKSSRQFKLPARFNDYIVNSSKKYRLKKVVKYSHLSFGNYCFSTSLNKSVEPSTFYKGVMDRNWVDVVNAKFEALNRNNTWSITCLPKGSKWIFKIKDKASGEIERYKARQVAKGFSQRECIDYDETFSPIVTMTTVRCLINIVVQKDWPLYQLHVNNAFLYFDLCKDVYMTLPPGFSSNNDNVGSRDTFVALLVYVDDIVIRGSDVKQIESFKQYLKSEFKIKDLFLLKYFLGIEVLRNDMVVCLTQRKYRLEVLHVFGLLIAKPVLSPLPANFILTHI